MTWQQKNIDQCNGSNLLILINIAKGFGNLKHFWKEQDITANISSLFFKFKSIGFI